LQDYGEKVAHVGLQGKFTLQQRCYSWLKLATPPTLQQSLVPVKNSYWILRYWKFNCK